MALLTPYPFTVVRVLHVLERSNMTGPPIEIPVRLVGDDTGVVTAIRQLSEHLKAIAGPAARAKEELNKTGDAAKKAGGETKTLAVGSGARRPPSARSSVSRRRGNWPASWPTRSRSPIEMGKLAEKTGLAVETLSALAFAGRTADVEVGQLDGAFRNFNT